jgi:8-oxo-dGTP diphosphatase
LPLWSRRVYLSLTHPRFLIGVMALIRDEQGRVLILEHTYRREYPWGLPGGYLQPREEPAEGLRREVDELLSAGLYRRDQLDLLYRARVVGGVQHASPEVRAWQFAEERELLAILPNQLTMLRRAGQLQSS